MLEIRSRGGQPVRLALTRPVAGGGTATYARLLHEVLWDDLHHSMAFEMVDPDRYPDVGPGESIPWDRWRATGAEALLQTSIELQEERVFVEFRLHDIATGEQRVGKRYSQAVGGLTPGDAEYRIRRVAHLINDEAVLFITGVRGVASTDIAFVSDRSVVAPQKEIFIMDADGARQRRITFDASIALSPSFSPQADRIVYQTYRMRNGVPNTALFMILKGGGAPRGLVTCRGTNLGPSFSPDGTLLVLASSCDTDNLEIHTVRPDGSGLTRITRNPGADVSPSWSPNGRQIVFVSDRSGRPELYVMDSSGLNTRRLDTSGGQKDDPVWQPVRGDLVAYTASTGGGNFDIFVYDFESGRSYRLTSGSGRKESPTWSADGRQIAFEWARGDSVQIWAMGLDGSRQRMLTGTGNNLTPSWGDRP